MPQRSIGVVLFLVTDVSVDSRQVLRAHRENGVATLPLELLVQPDSLVDPPRRRALYVVGKLGESHSGWDGGNHVDVVWHPVHLTNFAS